MGFAGTVNGRIFEPPSWVDKRKPPGHTSQAGVYGQSTWWRSMVTLEYFVWSPNLVWALIAAAVYTLFPYDYAAARSWAVPWVAQRAALNLALVVAYFGFWNATLYALSFGRRKFKPRSAPSLPRMIHNLWYCLLGVLQWTAWEAIFVHCYATGKLPYVSDAEALATPANMAAVVAWTLFVPLWRDLHFYFAHRFIHIRVLYKYVHSLHHRNTDIEPFAGLCMHPIEHLYYFSCVGPSLYVRATPFLFLFNGIHLLLSPAASHSGWEDNWQSDQFHYLHHAKFECNYGTPGLPLDHWFGTFRDKLGASATYKGAWSDDAEHEAKGAGVRKASVASADRSALPESESGEWRESREDTAGRRKEWLSGRATLHGALPRLQDAVYLLFCVTMAAVLVCAAAGVGGLERVSIAGFGAAQWVAALIALGPIAFGFLLLLVTGDRYSPRWPFHKEPLVGNFGLHVVLGLLLTAMPVYHTVEMLLGPTSAYSRLWG